MLSGSANSPAAMVGRVAEHQKDILPGKFSRQHVEERLEACGVRGRHDQVDTSSVLWNDRAVQIDVFADELGSDRRPRSDQESGERLPEVAGRHAA